MIFLTLVKIFTVVPLSINYLKYVWLNTLIKLMETIKEGTVNYSLPLKITNDKYL